MNISKTACAVISIILLAAAATAFPLKTGYTLQEAMFYQKLPDSTVRCELCPHRCTLQPGQRGLCRVRLNENGTLFSLVFGRPCTVNTGPIEKAPFFHFLPGSKRLCIATAGCNLRCSFCQNWDISQSRPEDIDSYEMSPEAVVQKARELKMDSICFTYSEPVIFYEYIYETCRIAQKYGMRTAVVSNGYINEEPLKKLLPVIDAIKIDLKSFSNDFYRDVCMADLSSVLSTLKIIKESKKHLEIVVLIIPTLNDSEKEISAMCEWIHKNLGDDVPLHFSRFIPQYKLTNLPMTPVSTLDRAYSIAKKNHINYVYVGNVPGHQNNSTYCPGCAKRIIHRIQYEVVENHVVEGKCEYCGLPIPGFWK
jgi:pyruvate formate lyase activating enzyme